MKLMIPLFALIASPALAQTETQEFELSSITSFELHNTSGDATVRKATGTKAKVTSHKKKFDKECKLEVTKAGSKIIVNVDQPFRKTCEVDFEIELPEMASMDLRSSTGDFDVIGTKGDITYRVGAGDVEIKADAQKIDGRSGTGELEAKGILGDVNVMTGSGDTKLFYTKAPTTGEVAIKSGSGNAEITLPKDTKLISDSTIGAGKFYNEFGDDKDAGFRVNFKAGAGSLKILKAKK